jgi:hypothetical protein
MDIICSGPGPHEPKDGVLGKADRAVTGIVCPLCAELLHAEQRIMQEKEATDANNRATVESQAKTALDGNRTYLAIATPTNAQVAAQVRALTRQANGLIRLALAQFDGTN